MPKKISSSKKTTRKAEKNQKKPKEKEINEKDLVKRIKALIEKERKKTKVTNKTPNKKRGIDFNDFENSVSTQGISGAKAPVLERIAGQQQRPVFVSRFAQSQQTQANSRENNSNNEMKYIPNGTSASEPKYISYEANRISSEMSRIDMSQVGRQKTEYASNINQDALFQGSSQLRQMNFESPMQERVSMPERFDSEKAGRKSPFEEQQEKYKTYKPKLPKG